MTLSNIPSVLVNSDHPMGVQISEILRDVLNELGLSEHQAQGVLTSCHFRESLKRLLQNEGGVFVIRGTHIVKPEGKVIVPDQDIFVDPKIFFSQPNIRLEEGFRCNILPVLKPVLDISRQAYEVCSLRTFARGDQIYDHLPKRCYRNFIHWTAIVHLIEAKLYNSNGRPTIFLMKGVCGKLLIVSVGYNHNSEIWTIDADDVKVEHFY